MIPRDPGSRSLGSDLGIHFWGYFYTGMRSRRILSDSGSDSGLKISTPTPTPTPLRLRLNRMYSIRKTVIWCSYFLDFTFDCIQTDDTLIYPPFVPTADAGSLGYHWYLWIWSVCQSLNALTQSKIDRDGSKIISNTLIRRNSITKRRFSFIWTLLLSFSSCLSMFLGGWITVRPKSSSVDGW